MRVLEGLCPACYEHTMASESCCGQGAWVEGGVVSEQEAEQELEANSPLDPSRMPQDR